MGVMSHAPTRQTVKPLQTLMNTFSGNFGDKRREHVRVAAPGFARREKRGAVVVSTGIHERRIATLVGIILVG